ncbi:MAG: glycine oxidase ThiO [Pirellulaceae bacterium]
MEDCVIVGAGVVGLSLAYELSCQGLRVRVIDRGEPGREASWAGAGILPPANPNTADHPYEQLRGISHQLHAVWAERLREETGIDTGYRRCGGIYLARTAGEAASLAGLADVCRDLQVEMKKLPAEEIVRLEPALAVPCEAGEVRAAYWLPDEAQLRNPWHLAALRRACELRQVVIDGQVTVYEPSRDGRVLTVLRTSAGDLHAGCYCLCAGAWSGELLRRWGVETGILPIRGQMVLLRGPERPFRHVLNEGSRYLVAREDGYVLAGSTEEEAGFDKGTTPEGIDELLHFAHTIVPALRLFRVERTWAGLRPGTYDGFPYIGPVPEWDNVYAAAGHFRSGLHMSPGTAVVVGQLVRGERPEIDLSPFRVGRG